MSYKCKMRLNTCICIIQLLFSVQFILYTSNLFIIYSIHHCNSCLSCLAHLGAGQEHHLHCHKMRQNVWVIQLLFSIQFTFSNLFFRRYVTCVVSVCSKTNSKTYKKIGKSQWKNTHVVAMTCKDHVTELAKTISFTDWSVGIGVNLF